MTDNRIGFWILGFLCCGWPLLAGVVAINLYKRWQRGGLHALLPSLGRKEY